MPYLHNSIEMRLTVLVTAYLQTKDSYQDNDKITATQVKGYGLAVNDVMAD